MSNHRRHRRRLHPRIRRRAAPGTKPGTLNVAPDAIHSAIDVIAYDKDRIVEQAVADPKQLQQFLSQWPVVWVNVVGLGSEETLKRIAAIFNIHPLAMEDVVNVHQRAKADQFDQNVFCVVRMPDAQREELTEQLSLILGKNYVVTFQEGPGDCFDLVRARLRYEHSVMRQETQADYLAYRLIDALVDAYFPIMENIGDRLDELDDRMVAGNGHGAFAALHGVKRELLMLRRAIWPLRDAIRELQTEVTPFIGNQTRLFLRDCHDHAIQLIDLLESYRDIASDIRDFYLSSVSTRMNEIMKTLTIIATIFMPLSFVASWYGMNFKTEVSPYNMPELNWRYGYPFAIAIVLVIAAAMIHYFKRHGWIWRKDLPAEPAAESHQSGDEPRRT
jgi:magnesium transporter